MVLDILLFIVYVNCKVLDAADLEEWRIFQARQREKAIEEVIDWNWLCQKTCSQGSIWQPRNHHPLATRRRTPTWRKQTFCQGKWNSNKLSIWRVFPIHYTVNDGFDAFDEIPEQTMGPVLCTIPSLECLVWSKRLDHIYSAHPSPTQGGWHH